MWHGIIGHDDVVERFRQTLAAAGWRARIYSWGRRASASGGLRWSWPTRCSARKRPRASLQPCGKCESCRMFAAGNHPDLGSGRPAGRQSRRCRSSCSSATSEHRNQEGLCHRLGMRPFFGRRKVAIVDDADHFSIPSANCLLKTLEEPPPSALLILIGTSPSRQLPTIRSRSQIVRFQPLTRKRSQIFWWKRAPSPIAISRGASPSSAKAASNGPCRLADPCPVRISATNCLPRSMPHGSIACDWREPFRRLSTRPARSRPQRRDRLRIVVGFAVEFYRVQMRESPSERKRAGFTRWMPV